MKYLVSAFVLILFSCSSLEKNHRLFGKWASLPSDDPRFCSKDVTVFDFDGDTTLLWYTHGNVEDSTFIEYSYKIVGNKIELKQDWHKWTMTNIFVGEKVLTFDIDEEMNPCAYYRIE